MQKFPLRMKDNDLLVTELYRDPNSDPVTAISVYLTPKTSKLYLLVLSTYVLSFISPLNFWEIKALCFTPASERGREGMPQV